MTYVEYRSNNSGGSWWLADEQWKALEEAGWKVAWASLDHLYTDDGMSAREEDGTPKLVPAGTGNSKHGTWATKDKDGTYRYMGALARDAYRAGLSLRDAADEWERVTGMSATEAGCPCCGQPHNFTEYDDNGKYVTSGPDISYSASWQGERSNPMIFREKAIDATDLRRAKRYQELLQREIGYIQCSAPASSKLSFDECSELDQLRRALADEYADFIGQCSCEVTV